MNTLTITSESWFVPFDILMICCLLTSIILGTFFLLIILLDKTCHTIPMMLVANSCLSLTTFPGIILWMTIVTLKNDLQQIAHEDVLCAFRGYLSYVFVAAMNYSFLLQAIYRYIIAIHPIFPSWQSIRTQLLLICLSWIVAFLYPLVFLFTGAIIYNAENQVCQIPFRISVSLVFMIFIAYLMPVTLIQLAYFQLIRQVKQSSHRLTFGNFLPRLQRELKMVRRILSIVTILVVACFPYTVFIVMSFVTDPPRYHLRIASAFIDTSTIMIIVTLFFFTDPLKLSIMRKMKRRINTVVPTIQ